MQTSLPIESFSLEAEFDHVASIGFDCSMKNLGASSNSDYKYLHTNCFVGGVPIVQNLQDPFLVLELGTLLLYDHPHTHNSIS